MILRKTRWLTSSNSWMCVKTIVHHHCNAMHRCIDDIDDNCYLSTCNILHPFIKRRKIGLKRNRYLQSANKNIGVASQCLKITEKVAFYIASEASYIYILNRQKHIENAKIGPFWRVFENLKLAVKQCYSVTRQVTFYRTKIGWKCQNWKIQMRHFE